MGLLVALADKETLADRSGLEFVTSHCNDPLIALRHRSPSPSSFRVPGSLLKFDGGVKLASFNDLVYSS